MRITDVQAAIATAVNRVSGIYQQEVAVRLQLIPNVDDLIYLRSDPGCADGDNSAPSCSPFSNGSELALNQSVTDEIIGDANYDIGHLLNTRGGGLAALRVVGVSGNKARGYTGLSRPTGDGFHVDLLAHELGHQYGGNHTFNGAKSNCTGNRSVAAYEPGSGSTIQAYAGICGEDDLQQRGNATRGDRQQRPVPPLDQLRRDHHAPRSHGLLGRRQRRHDDPVGTTRCRPSTPATTSPFQHRHPSS